jgi:hypothetical protein
MNNPILSSRFGEHKKIHKQEQQKQEEEVVEELLTVIKVLIIEILCKNLLLIKIHNPELSLNQGLISQQDIKEEVKIPRYNREKLK